MNRFAIFEDLKGLTLSKVEEDAHREELRFVAEDGREFRLYHDQSCCEHVSIEDICGDLEDLVGSEILRAEERTEEVKDADYAQYTFYELATMKGSVTLRWYGKSNGYYSVSVDFEQVFHGR